MSDNETIDATKDYAELLTSFSDEELEREKYEEVNRMLASNVELFKAKHADPVDNQEVENWTAAVNWATSNARAVFQEIRRRAGLEEKTAEGAFPTDEQMRHSLLEARIAALDNWLERAGELTDMARTLMSMTLNLASALPTEGSYNAHTWSYPRIQDRAQDAETSLVKARKQAQHAARYIESAMRGVNEMKGILRSEERDEFPDRDDSIPF